MHFSGYDQTGKPYVNVPAFGYRDADSRPFVPVPTVGGSSANEYLDIQAKRDAIKAMKVAGLKIPKEVTCAFTLYDSVASFTIAAPIPNITALTPDEARNALDEYITAKARESVATAAKDIVVGQAHGVVTRAFGAATDDVLGQLRPEYDRLATEFADAYPLVQGLKDIGTAARADQTGDAVAAWRTAENSARGLNAITDMVLILTKPVSKTSARYVDAAFARIPCLVADIASADNLMAIVRTSDDVRMSRITDQIPFGIYGPVLDAGATLSLPENREDWDYRIDSYESAREIAVYDFWNN